MYYLDYSRLQSTEFSHNSNSSNEHEKDEKLDFTDFLNKLVYQMIFNNKESYYSDVSSNSSSMKQAKKTKNIIK
jgi:hypothetical protein